MQQQVPNSQWKQYPLHSPAKFHYSWLSSCSCSRSTSYYPAHKHCCQGTDQSPHSWTLTDKDAPGWVARQDQNISRSPSSQDQPRLLHLHCKSISLVSSTLLGYTSQSTSPSMKAKPVYCLSISDSAAPIDLDIAPQNSQHAYSHRSLCSNGKHQSQYRIDKATDVCLILILPKRSLT